MSDALPPPETSPNATSPVAAESAWVRVARRISRRTTDLLAIGIVAVTALMVGGRLSEWWQTEPDDFSTPADVADFVSGSAGQWGSGGSPVTVEFGGLTQSLRRETFHGTEEALVERLLEWCRRTVQESDLPEFPPTESEARLTSKLAHLTPTAETAGRGRVYLVQRPSRMVFGTRSSDGGGKSDAGRGERMVCWGFAFPQGKRTWTTFLSGSQSAAARISPVPEVALPKGCERVLSLRSDGGDGLMAFAGASDIAESRAELDRWFVDREWRLASPWREYAGRWTVRYATPLRDDSRSGWTGTVDMEIQSDGPGRVRGLMNFLPRRPPDK